MIRISKWLLIAVWLLLAGFLVLAVLSGTNALHIR
jgi:hypothetical protein